MFFYAQIDNNGRVVAVTQTTREISKATLIPISEHDATLIDKIYNSGTKKFDSPPPSPPSRRDKALQLLKSVDRQALMSTDPGKVLAAIALLVVDINAEDIGS